MWGFCFIRRSPRDESRGYFLFIAAGIFFRYLICLVETTGNNPDIHIGESNHIVITT